MRLEINMVVSKIVIAKVGPFGCSHLIYPDIVFPHCFEGIYGMYVIGAPHNFGQPQKFIDL